MGNMLIMRTQIHQLNKMYIEVVRTLPIDVVQKYFDMVIAMINMVRALSDVQVDKLINTINFSLK
jgi:hypothetical protein